MDTASLYNYRDKDFILQQTLDSIPNRDHFRMHTHANIEIYYFIRGKGVFHVEGNAYPLEPGDLLVMQPAEAHCIEIDTSEPYERCFLNFSPRFFQSIDPDNQLVKAIMQRKPGKDNRYRNYEFPGGCKQYIQAMLSPEGDPRLNLLSGLTGLLSQLHRLYSDRAAVPQQEPDTPEYRIIHYINQNLSKPLTLDQLCDRFFVSKSQLCRMFKRSTGTTVWHYITVKRLIKAQQLLRRGEHPSHVYTRCGFSNYSVFFRAYVKQFGYAPTRETPE